MLPESLVNLPQSSFFDITQQLDLNHPLLALGRALDWPELEQVFTSFYSAKERNAKPQRPPEFA